MAHGKKVIDPSTRLLLTPQPQFIDGARLFAVRRVIKRSIPTLLIGKSWVITTDLQPQLCFIHWDKPVEIYRDCSQAEWEFWSEQGIPSLGDVCDE